MSGSLCSAPGKTNGNIKNSKAFCEGRQARLLNEDAATQPHAVGSEAEEAWLYGWYVTDQATGNYVGKLGCCGALGDITGAATPLLPRWVSSIPEMSAPQGGTWDYDLNDYIITGPIDTFSLPTGTLPTGITLNPDGTFSGTVTNIGGQGTSDFEATNVVDSVLSPRVSWSISQ